MNNIDFRRFIDNIFINFKKRFSFLLIFLVMLLIIPALYKGTRYVGYSNKDVSDIILQNEVLEQKFNTTFNKPKKILLEVGKVSPNVGSEYKVEVTYKEEVIAQAIINTKELEEKQEILMVLPKIKTELNDEITIRIQGNAINSLEGLKVYSYKSDNEVFTINGRESGKTINMKVGYNRFSKQYIYLIGLISISGCILILIIDVKKIHKSVFYIIMILGSLVIFINPILDTPDDHAHLCRTEFTARGILSLKGDSDQYNISRSVAEIISHNYENIINANLGKMDFTYDKVSKNYASSNNFIPYIPQAIGFNIAKIFGSNIAIVILGRFFNLLAYALMVRYALKKTPLFKIPLSIVAIMPMSLFIAASFNPDATTYGLSLIAISFLLYIYNKKDVNKIDMSIYAILCLVLALVKLPYCILGGALIFIPKNRFRNNREYYFSFLFVSIVASISLIIGLKALLGSGGGTSEYSSFFVENNISSDRQLSYIISNPIIFGVNFIKAMLDNLRMYLDQLNTYGWLSYGANSAVKTIYPILIGGIIMLYPTKEVLSKKLKWGLALISLGIYATTCFIMYVSWTPVGGAGIDGVQGRYFVPVIAILMLFSGAKSTEDDSKKDFRYLFIAIIFVIFLLIFMMNRYY